MPPSVLALLAFSVALAAAADADADVPATLTRAFLAVLDVYAPTSASLGAAACRSHGRAMRSGVLRGELWALRMLDASTKLPSGLLSGNLVQLGNVDQCLSVQHEHPELGPISGQHCLVSVGARTSTSMLRLADKMDADGFHGTGLDAVEALLAQGRFTDALSHVGATWSLCVPASCSAAQLQQHLRSTLSGLLDVRVDDLACMSQERYDAQPMATGAIAVIALLGCFVVLAAAGTAYDLYTEHSTGARNEHLLCASLYTNGSDLLAVRPTAGKLAAFDGLRCISILWSMLVHHSIFAMQVSATNYRHLTEVARDWTHLLVANGTFSTDSFLMMSGALVAYNFLRDRDRHVHFRFGRYYLNRYCRLSPLFAVTTLMTWTLLNTLSDAPFTQACGRHLVEACAKFAWHSPLYLVNFFDKDHMCMAQSWSTSVDMQLFWLSPLLLFPLWKRPKLGLALLGAAATACTAVVFRSAYQLQQPLLNILRASPSSPYMQKLFFPTHVRATGWLIGVALGYLLHVTRLRQVVLTARQVTLGWLLSVLLTGYVLLAGHAHFQPEAASLDRTAVALHIALMWPAWALATAWTLFACERGFGGFVNTFLGWRGWQVPSRLVYAMSFAHYNITMTMPVIQKTTHHYSAWVSLMQYFGLVVASVAIAVALHLVVEVPCQRLYRLRMGREPTLRTAEKDS